MAFFGFWLLFRPMTVATHELGHAIAGRLVGFDIFTVIIGTGPLFAAVRRGETRIELRQFLGTTGMTYGAAPWGRSSRWKHAVFSLGGPAANLLAGGAGLFLCYSLIPPTYSSSEWPIIIGCAFIASQLFSALFNLVPMKNRMTSGLPSDGLSILLLVKPLDRELLKRAWLHLRCAYLIQVRRDREAVDLLRSALAMFPQDSVLLATLLHVLARSSGATAAVQEHASHRPGEGAPSTDAEAAWLRANVAIFALLTWQPAHFQLADDYSRDALSILPDRPETVGTRGAVLVEKGEVAAGKEMLYQALRSAESAEDRALFATLLSRAEKASGNPELATELEHLAAHFDIRSQRAV